MLGESGKLDRVGSLVKNFVQRLEIFKIICGDLRYSVLFLFFLHLFPPFNQKVYDTKVEEATDKPLKSFTQMKLIIHDKNGHRPKLQQVKYAIFNLQEYMGIP